jgi:predicted O-methyltransferase YrrM
LAQRSLVIGDEVPGVDVVERQADQLGYGLLIAAGAGQGQARNIFTKSLPGTGVPPAAALPRPRGGARCCDGRLAVQSRALRWNAGGTAVEEELPPLVRQAQAVAGQAGFPLTRAAAGTGRPSACLPGVGRFLAVLAAGCTGGRIGELGTGAGIGTAWMAGAMPDDCTLITVERDERLAAAVRDLMAGGQGGHQGLGEPHPGQALWTGVHVITGDAFSVLSGQGPFDLLFADCGVRDGTGFASLVSLLRIGGRIVMDDLTPEQDLPPDSPWRSSDLKREFFHGEARLTSAEVVLPDLHNSLLVGTRRA